MQEFTKKQFWAELEEAGEEVVRERVIAKRYGSGNYKLELAQEWLRLKEQERIEAKEVSSEMLTKEGLEITRSSKNAAWVAAICAVIAVFVSITALWVSLTKNG